MTSDLLAKKELETKGNTLRQIKILQLSKDLFRSDAKTDRQDIGNKQIM